MFQHQGIWLPDGEKHFPEWMTKNGEIVDGRGTYQIKKLREAMKWCRDFRTAVDVGGHVGLWSMQLAKRFETVHAFEPVAQFLECFRANVADANVIVHDTACGEYYTTVDMHVDPADSGGTFVQAERNDGQGVEIAPLDWSNLEHVSFVKIDCEGYEHHVVAGARETLTKWRPCVIVEQKPHKLGPNFGIEGTPAIDLLRGMGAVVRAELGGDYILSWD